MGAGLGADKARVSVRSLVASSVEGTAVKRSIGLTLGFHNHLLKAPTRAFTFKTLLRHYAQW